MPVIKSLSFWFSVTGFWWLAVNVQNANGSTFFLRKDAPLMQKLPQHHNVAQQTEQSTSGDMFQTAGLPTSEGKWLFGSATHPCDELPVDEMLPHQLKQSSSRPFDHRVLYFSESFMRNGDGEIVSVPTDKQRSHSAVLERVKSMQLVDEMINLDNMNRSKMHELAKRSMTESSAMQFVEGKASRDDNSGKAMVAFLAKCMDGGFDHCAWLDGDIFVHRGATPWVDEAVQKSKEHPEIQVSTPSFAPMNQWHQNQEPTGFSFSSRYFVYHTKALQRLLPLERNYTDNTWEGFIQDNLNRMFEMNVHAAYQPSGQSGSWVIHAPGSKDLSHLLHACTSGSNGLQTLMYFLENVSKNGKHGEDSFNWRDDDEKHRHGNTESSDQDMDAAAWLEHLLHACPNILLASHRN